MPFDDVVESSAPVLGPVVARLQAESDIITWPWPRLLMTKYHCFAFTVQGTGDLFLSECSLSSGRTYYTPVVNLGSALQVQQVDVADFGPYYVVSTFGFSQDALPIPIIRTFARELSIPVTFPCLFPLSLPVVGTCCNFRNQFLGANVLPGGFPLAPELGSDGVVWSGIGAFEMNPGVDVTAGFMRVRFPYNTGQVPVIYRVFPHYSGIVLYSDAGKVILIPREIETGFTYASHILPGLGIISGNHVAGDEHIHGFIDLEGDFWTQEFPTTQTTPDGGAVKKLGYRNYIKEMLEFSKSEDSRVTVSYLPRNKRFYISNGDKCLIINEFGACQIHQCVSSLVQGSDRNLYGTFRNASNTQALIVSDEMDFGTRALKSIESITGGVVHAPQEDVSFAVDWRMSQGDLWKRSPWRPAGPAGQAVIKITAVEFRICVRITNYIDAQVEYLGLNVKFPDNRFKRGFELREDNLISTRNEL